MSCCSIRWCGKNSKTSNYKTNGITFHRFPKEPGLKEKWIGCTKRENWFPSYYSVICSRHFTEDCFYPVKSRRCLFDTATPTLHLPLVSNKTVTSSEYALESPILSSLLSQYEPTTPRATERKATDPETPSQYYSPTKRLCRRVIKLSNQLQHKNKTIKVLRDTVRYHRKKVATLKVIIKELLRANKR